MELRDNPDLERATRCALPIIFTSLDHPEYPGIQGTCTALRDAGDAIFVAAAHVVARCDSRTIVEIGLGFRGEPLRARIRQMLKPRPTGERYDAVCDFAVMFPDNSPAFVAGESDAYDLARVAGLDAVPRGSLFGVCGYPSSYSDRNVIDYDSRTVTFGRHLAIGSYEGPSTITGHHVLQISTAEIGGPNGFSGSPVFRLSAAQERGTWAPAFAGIVTLGGPRQLQFIDVEFLGTFLRNEVFRRSP
jgi:hypothetical protein